MENGEGEGVVPRRPFKLDDIITQACESAQAADFGPEGWQEGLAVLLHCINGELDLSPLGRNVFRHLLSRALGARLRLVRWAGEHREEAARPVEKPVLIVGMARAGTTLLSCLLDLDERFRSLLNWEVADPVPPPRPHELRSGTRVHEAARFESLVDHLNGGMRAVHFEGPASPTECLGLLSQHFLSITWLFGSSPTYSRWLLSTDHRSAYQYHRLALQVLHAHTTRRWSLKAIQHVVALETLTSVYPDARLVLMHRDPVVMAASACSLFNHSLRVFTTADCRPAVASSYLDFLEAAIHRSSRFMDEHPRWPMVEVRYHEFVADHLSTVRRIYDAFDEQLPPAVEQRMRQWLVDHPQGEFGHHRYSLDALGLSRGEIEERFGAYRDRYDLAPEPVPD